MTTLLAGPFVGEFGYELFAFQGHVRAMSRDFDSTIVYSRQESRHLYDDFVNKFVPVDVGSYNCDRFDCISGGKVHEPMWPDGIVTNFRVSNKGKTMAQLKALDRHVPPEYVKYGSGKHNGYVVVHARAISEGNAHKRSRNWSGENWCSLVSMLLNEGHNLVCVGSKQQSIALDGCQDLRGIELHKLCDILSGADCILGPSSGPMHLATLCGCPQLVWSYSRNRMRYEQEWNPFSTPVCFYDRGDFDPTAYEIYQAFDMCMEDGFDVANNHYRWI